MNVTPLPRTGRDGITLFEVVIALVLFTLTLPALATLISLGADNANQSAILSRASLECRSKLAEVTVGAESLSAVDWAGIQDTNFEWKLTVTDGPAEGLKQVQVSVRIAGESNVALATLSQYIIDPAYRGSTQDRGLLAVMPEPSTSSGSSTTDPSSISSSTNTSSNSTSGTNSTKTGGTGAAGGTGAGGGAGGGARGGTGAGGGMGGSGGARGGAGAGGGTGTGGGTGAGGGSGGARGGAGAGGGTGAGGGAGGMGGGRGGTK